MSIWNHLRREAVRQFCEAVIKEAMSLDKFIQDHAPKFEEIDRMVN